MCCKNVGKLFFPNDAASAIGIGDKDFACTFGEAVGYLPSLPKVVEISHVCLLGVGLFLGSKLCQHCFCSKDKSHKD